MIYRHRDRTYRHRDRNGSLVRKGEAVAVDQDFIGIGGICTVKEDEGGLYLENNRTTRQLYLDLVLSQLITIQTTDEDDDIENMGYMEAFTSGLT